MAFWMAIPYIISAASQFASAKSNQKAAEAEGIFAKQKAELDENRFRMDAERFRGRQAAIANKAGRPLTAGSIADLRAEQFGEDELDALVIRFGGDISSYRANLQANQFQRQSIMGPVSTILGGLGKTGAFDPGSTQPTVGNVSSPSNFSFDSKYFGTIR